MTDEAPVQGSDGASEAWVTSSPGPAERAPGIDDVSETTYVDPPASGRRRSLVIGGAIGAGVVALVALIVVTAGSSGETNGAAPRPHRKPAHHSSTATSSTTWEPAAPSTTVPTTATTAAAPPPTTAAPPTTTAPPPATPRATADPAAPVYQPVGLPAGVSATLTGCSWQPSASGRYEASGTLTNAPSTNHGWTITMHWLQAGREIGQQRAAIDLGPGASKPWSLILAAPTPPADPFSCALSVA